MTALLFGSAVLFAAPFVTRAAGPIPGEAVVKLGQGAGSAHAFSGAGVEVVDSIAALHAYLVRFPVTISFKSKRLDLIQHPGVMVVEPNYEMGMLETFQMSISFPDEDAPVYLNGEQPKAYYEQPSVYSIGLDSAQLLSTGAGVSVAVIDNGIDLTHPLFSDIPDSMTHDFVDKDSDPSEVAGSLRGHGTFVAGLVKLAAPNCSLIVARAFDGDGLSNSFTVSQAINWAVECGAKVINMSFGTLTDSKVLAQACQRAVDGGVILVASVGNSGLVGTPVYPAAYPGVIAVSSLDTTDLIASFSNSFDGVDVAAPGVNLYSALPSPYRWGTWSGTSFSAPLVAAVCALDRSLALMTSQAAERLIQSTATRDLMWGTVNPPDPSYGYGRVDAYASVLALRAGDLNNSGTLDVGDLGLEALIVSGGAVPSGTIIRMGDLNGDGIVNQADIDLLSQRFFNSDSPH